MGKNTGKVREFCQSGKVGTLYFTTTCPFLVKVLISDGLFQLPGSDSDSDSDSKPYGYIVLCIKCFC